MIILLYHNVIAHRPSAFNMLARPDWLTVDEFDGEIASLAERFDIVSVDDIASAVSSRRRIPRACAITFDDGYRGAYKYGLPVVEKHGATAAYFVITGQFDGDATSAYDFFDRLEAQVFLTKAANIDLGKVGLNAMPLTCDACKLAFLKYMNREIKTVPESQYDAVVGALDAQLGVDESATMEYLSHEAFQPMSWDDVDDVRRRGHIIGSHSRSHRALSQLEEETLSCEVAGSYDDLRRHCGEDGFAIAYPFGLQEHYNEDVTDACKKAKFSYGLTAITGVNDEHASPFELRRATFRELKKLRRAI